MAHGRAEALDHRLDDVVAANADAVGRERGRQVAVAEVPGDAHQFGWRRGGDLGERLRRGAHEDQPSVLQLQRVAVAKRDRLGEIEQEFELARALHRDAAPVPLVVVENDRVGGEHGLARPLSRGQHTGRAGRGHQNRK